MLTIQKFTFNAFSENTYLVSDDETKECLVVDPGCYERSEQDSLAAYIKQEKLTVTKILNTHCHIDHVLGNSFCKQAFGVPLAIPKGEQVVLSSVPSYAASYGFGAYEPATADELLDSEGTVQVGKQTLEILYVPGHSPGHLAFYHAPQNVCIGGDVLFRESIGRTDLPGGNFDTLAASIRTKMYSLPEETVIYCGHGPETTIGHEKRYNPFVK